MLVCLYYLKYFLGKENQKVVTNMDMVQKIQSFKMLELPKIHRELEKIIKKIARINKDIRDEKNKLCSLYPKLNKKRGVIDLAMPLK